MAKSAVAQVRLEDGRSVKLGRIRPLGIFHAGRYQLVLKPDMTVALVAMLGLNYDPDQDRVPPPDSTNWAEKAMRAISQVYGNNKWGDCVIAGKMHQVGVWTANDEGPIAVGTEQEAYSQYQAICGPGDNGCVITEVLDHFKTKGMTVGGKNYKIDDYVAVDHGNQQLVMVATEIFGGGTIGINLPQAWTSTNTVWNTPTGAGAIIIGGHDIDIVDYINKPDPTRFGGATGVVCATWGGLVLITWPAFMDYRYVEECYFSLSPDWYGKDNLAPNGINVTSLKQDLLILASGNIPPLNPPTPPTPTPVPVPVPVPTPPVEVPPVYDVTLTGNFGLFGQKVTMVGTAVPRAGK